MADEDAVAAMTDAPAEDAAEAPRRGAQRKADPKAVVKRMQALTSKGSTAGAAADKLASEFGVAASTVARIWREHNRATGTLKPRASRAAAGLPGRRSQVGKAGGRRKAGATADVVRALREAANIIEAQQARIEELERALAGIRRYV